MGTLHKGTFVNSQFSTIFDLIITLTCDLLTLKSYSFIFVPKCTVVVNLVNFPQVVVSYHKLLMYDLRHTDTDRRTHRQNTFHSKSPAKAETLKQSIFKCTHHTVSNCTKSWAKIGKRLLQKSATAI